MKKLLTLSLFLSLAFMQGKIGGYAIFDFNGTTQQFDIDRTYFQYTNDISDNLFFKLRFDVGRSSDILDADSNNENDDQFEADSKLIVYLKNVYIDWKCPQGGKLTMGLLGTNSYGVQEKNWGYRFISKSVLDSYGMTKTADFGIGYSHSFGDFNMNIQAVNGEGFKADFDPENINDDKPTAYIRLMYGEENLTKNEGFNVGMVYTTAYNSTDKDYSNNLSGIFSGYAGHNFRLGVEFNRQKIDEIGENAHALYFNYAFNDKIALFTRYDVNNENTGNNSSTSKTLLGLVFNPTKGLYIAPNIIVENITDDIGEPRTEEYRLTCMFKY